MVSSISRIFANAKHCYMFLLYNKIYNNLV